MSIFNKILALFLRPWFILIFFTFVAISYFYLDRDIALYAFSLNLRKELYFLNWITFFGSAKFYVLFLPVLAVIFGYVLRKKSWALKTWMLWVVVLYPSLITLVFKMILGRARPIVYFNQEDFGFFGWHTERQYHSFPSGHTTAVTSLCVGLLILFPRYFYYWATICLLVLLSRVLLTYHYLSDVCVSFYLVFLELGIFTYIMQRKFPKTCELVLK